ncbi:MAG: site-2 protease family protein [Candidatus Marinimicrobia bacterium]|nr:site-2 protease family protein [Candidatus Neomarinimicrobiota bacterium]
MLFRVGLEILILLLPALILSLCVHEYAHGVVAYYYGDDTAERHGRLTLNPVKHLDPIGTLMLLTIGFGYAKPVPVNPYNLNNPRLDMIKVAAAGPISNLILSFIGLFLIYVFKIFFPILLNQNVYTFLEIFIQINIFLAIFNLIPVYPLDGGQIFGNIISKYNPSFSQQLNYYGPRVLFGIIAFSLISGISLIGGILYPISNVIRSIFEIILNLIFYLFI